MTDTHATVSERARKDVTTGRLTMRQHCEPDLEQLLADPLIRLVMASDNVAEGDVRRLADRARFSRARSADASHASGMAGEPRSFRPPGEAGETFGFAPNRGVKGDHRANLGWAC